MDTAIAEAQSPETFDVLSFLEQTAYPTETVVVHQDVKSADSYIKLHAQLQELEKEENTDLDAVNSLSDEITALGEKIKKSAIVFTLRGMPPGIVQQIVSPVGLDPELDTPQAAIDRDNELIARSIISVSNANGVKDETVWDAKKVAKLRTFLKEGEFGKLVKGVADVNFNAAIFDQATDAGFPGGSSDLAG